MASEEVLTAADGWGVRREGVTREGEAVSHLIRGVGLTLCGVAVGDGWYVLPLEGREVCRDCAAELEGIRSRARAIIAAPAAAEPSARDVRWARTAVVWVRQGATGSWCATPATHSFDGVTLCGKGWGGESWRVVATMPAEKCDACMQFFPHAVPAAPSAQEERAAIAAWLRRDPLGRIAQAYAQGIELGLHWGETERQSQEALEAARAKKEGDDSARAELLLAGKRLGEVADRIEEARQQQRPFGAGWRGSSYGVIEEDDRDFLSDLGAALVEYFGAKGGGR
jgi:hypothetical protein